MADKTILELTDLGTLQSSDMLPAARSGRNEDNGTTIGAINTYVVGQADAEPTEDSPKLVKSGGVFGAIVAAIATIKSWAEGLFAKVDGWYSQLTAGLAENLVDTKGSGTEQSILNRTSCGDVSIADDGSGVIKSIKGKTVKFNQLFNSAANTPFNITTSDGTNPALVIPSSTYDIVAGHKYYRRANVNVSSGTLDNVPMYQSWYTGSDGGLTINTGTIITASSSQTVPATKVGGLRIADEYTHTVSGTISFIIVDLTAIFGSGNEPTTVADFEAWLAANVGLKGYYPYNTGTLLNNSAKYLETVGFNQWDEEWELGGIAGATGENNTASNWSRSKNYNSIFPNTTYYLKKVANVDCIVFFYDSEFGYLGQSARIVPTTASEGCEFTTPSNAAYFRIIWEQTTYNNDICINLSWSGYRNGEYEPYWLRQTALNLDEFDVKDGEGNVTTIHGLKQAGSVYDEIKDGKFIQRVGVVDLGSLSFIYIDGQQRFSGDGPSDGLSNSPNFLCAKYTSTINNTTLLNSNKIILYNTFDYSDYKIVFRDLTYTGADLNNSKAPWLEGVQLYYELATPIEYDLVNPINGTYKVADFGVERIVPLFDENGNPLTAPFVAVIKYNNDFTSEMRNLPTNYVRRDALKQSIGQDATLPYSQKGVDDNYARKIGTENDLTSGLSKNLIDTHGVGSEQEFVFRPTGGGTAISGNGNVTIQKFKGKSLVWNQLIEDNNFTTAGTGTGTYDSSTDTTSFSEIISTGYGYVGKSFETVLGHKYYMSVFYDVPNATHFWAKPSNASPTPAAKSNIGAGKYSFIQECTIASSSVLVGYSATNGTSISGTVTKVNIIDLTLMFGAGNEPSTVAEFEALFPNSYYAYNEGTIINNEVKQIETTGRNQWDEEWKLGYWNSTGWHDNNNFLGSKNYIAVLPSTSYFFKSPTNVREVEFWDANKNYINKFTWNEGAANSDFLTPANCHYLTFYFGGSYGATYNHDICINLSDASFNGTYEAYHKNTTTINLDNFQVKDGEGNVITVNGLKSAGSVYDEIDPVRKKYIKRVGSVDLGDLDWSKTSRYFRGYLIDVGKLSGQFVSNSSQIIWRNEASVSGNEGTYEAYITNVNSLDWYYPVSSYADGDAFKSAMSGVMLYYELATPIEYDLVTTIPDVYATPAGGTEGIVPQGVDEDGVPATAPFRGTNLYSKDYVQTINDMPVDFDATASIDAFTAALASALGTALNGTFTITRGSYDSTNKRYNWTVNFTANA